MTQRQEGKRAGEAGEEKYNAQCPIPNPQFQIPNPQSPIPNPQNYVPTTTKPYTPGMVTT